MITSSYREILQREYRSRKLSNPYYSMGAFARDIGLSSARLSEVLSKKQGLSRKAAYSVGKRLFNIENEIEYFSLLAESEHARSKEDRAIASRKLLKRSHQSSVSNFNLDVLQVVGEWYHMAIAELAKVSDFKPDPTWIANRLCITEEQAKDALDRLVRVGLLKKQGKRLVMNEHLVAFPTDIPSQVLRNLHRQLIQKANSALESQSIHERDITSLTLAFPSTQMAEAKKMIKNFRRSFNQKFQTSDSFDSVYVLNIQFFQAKGSPL